MDDYIHTFIKIETKHQFICEAAILHQRSEFSKILNDHNIKYVENYTHYNDKWILELCFKTREDMIQAKMIL